MEDKIIKEIDNLEEVKRFKELNNKIKSNKDYNSIISNFNKNKDKYIKNNTYNIELIKARKKLFEIDDVKEYLELENKIRLLSIKISNILSSIIEDNKC